MSINYNLRSQANLGARISSVDESLVERINQRSTMTLNIEFLPLAQGKDCLRAMNTNTVSGSAVGSQVTTAQEASNMLQANSQQHLTAMAPTSNFTTPAMTFGDVGITVDHDYGGHSGQSNSVGEFNETQLLERQTLIAEFDWAITDVVSTGDSWQTFDLLDNLFNTARNQAVLEQFGYFRADIECTVRLNSNQFYFGALMATVVPTGNTGQTMEERSVLDPMTISASSAESAVKTWHYSFPDAWLTQGRSFSSTNYPVYLNVDVLCPLTQANAAMPDHISVFVWARFVNVKLAYPHPSAESSKSLATMMTSLPSYPTVKRSKARSIAHPADDTGGSVDEVVEAVRNVTLGDLTGAATKLFSGLSGFMFDKPDQYEAHMPVIQEPSTDLFITDIPDSNPYYGMYKDHYLDPGIGRMPLTRDFTVSEYAQIPGLRATNVVFTAKNDNALFNLASKTPLTNNDQFLIPFDYAVLSSRLHRGSVKVHLQFFTSAFFSGRFSVQVGNVNDYATPFSLPDYTSGISRVVNVKGDTTDSFLVPYLDSKWWEKGSQAQQLFINLESDITSTETAQDPIIRLAVWISAGDDHQFAFPRVVQQAEWATPVGLPVAESSIGSIFKDSFPPIVPNAVYNIDQGYCNNETLTTVSSICKRYSPLLYVEFPASFNEAMVDLDNDGSLSGTKLREYNAFRNTNFGNWRACFLFRSGGTRWRWYAPSVPSWIGIQWGLEYTVPDSPEDILRVGNDLVGRVTLPQLDAYPYKMLTSTASGDALYSYFVLGTSAITTSTTAMYVAARDDLQFGFPILPARKLIPT